MQIGLDTDPRDCETKICPGTIIHTHVFICLDQVLGKSLVEEMQLASR